MLNTLTTTEIATIIASHVNTIERAVLSIVEFKPAAIWAMFEDLVSSATVKAIESLKGYQRRYASQEALTAWIMKAARWHVMNEVKRAEMFLVVARGKLHKVADTGAHAHERNEDAARLSAAMETLTNETRTVFLRLVNGEKAVDVAKSMGISNAGVTRRKQEALRIVTAAVKAA